jgi:aspartyl-tRNA(Asn)/glutamyl-tRNA(Gln) amidotransferase subunit A
MSELTSLTIAEARAKLRAKDIKATELTEAYISARSKRRTRSSTRM